MPSAAAPQAARFPQPKDAGDDIKAEANRNPIGKVLADVAPDVSRQTQAPIEAPNSVQPSSGLGDTFIEEDYYDEEDGPPPVPPSPPSLSPDSLPPPPPPAPRSTPDLSPASSLPPALPVAGTGPPAAPDAPQTFGEEPKPLPTVQEIAELLGPIDERYQILEVIGKGGMGTVLKARHAALQKLVAIKVLNCNFDEYSKKRFEQEAKAGSKLAHPNLVTVFDYGFTQKGEPYLVMEYLEGLTLDKLLLEQDRMQLAEFLNVFTQACKALQYIHNNNIVHRDIKTSNIILQIIDGECYVKLLDFGIAKIVSEQNTGQMNLTAAGEIFGSPLYMSPEQCMGANVDVRSDIYSLGCVMYECISGNPPLLAENALKVIYRHIHDTPPNLLSSRRGTPQETKVAAIIMRCLQKEKTARFQNAGELLNALNAIAAELSSPPELPHIPQAQEPGQANVHALAVDDDDELPPPLPVQPSVMESMPPPLPVTAPGIPNMPPPPPPRTQRTTKSTQKLKSNMNQFEEALGGNWRILALGVMGVLLISAILICGINLISPKSKDHTPAVTAAKEDEEKEEQAKPAAGSGEDSEEQRLSLLVAEAENVFDKGEAQYNSAKTKFEEALKKAEAAKDAELIGRIHARLGAIALKNKSLQSAHDHFATSLKVLKPKLNDNRDHYLAALIGMAHTLNKQKQYPQAENYLSDARELALEWEQPEIEADALLFSAKNATHIKNERAIEFYDQAIKSFQALDDPPADKIATCYLDEADIYLELKNKDVAQKKLDQAVSISAKLPDLSQKVKNRIASLTNPQHETTAAAAIDAAGGLSLPGSAAKPQSVLIGDITGCQMLVYVSKKDSVPGDYIGSHHWFGGRGNNLHFEYPLTSKVKHYIHVVLQPPSNDRCFVAFLRLTGAAKFANGMQAMDSRPDYWKVSTIGWGTGYHRPAIVPVGDHYTRQDQTIFRLYPAAPALMDPQTGLAYGGNVFFTAVINPK